MRVNVMPVRGLQPKKIYTAILYNCLQLIFVCNHYFTNKLFLRGESTVQFIPVRKIVIMLWVGKERSPFQRCRNFYNPKAGLPQQVGGRCQACM